MPMAMIATNMNSHIQKQLSKSLERALEEAHLSGELKLSGRKLKDFPKLNKINPKYHLNDTVYADLSKNRFSELPEEVTEFLFLEKLQLYHNAIRFIPENLSMMQSLTYLDLSRNQLTALPREICKLPLQILLVAYNRLSALPDELGRIASLTELDVGCNEISNLPAKIGDLSLLKSLDLRCNLLVHLPIELTYLRLAKLDISGNYITTIPNELRKMKSLIDLRVSENPLTSPPASLCIRGRVHIFKYLERQAAKQEKIRNGRIRRNPLDSRGHATLDIRSYRRHNIDNGFNTTDGTDKRWSQEIHSGNHINEARNARRPECSPLSITLPSDVSINGSFSGTSTPSTISPGGYMSLEDSLSNTGELHEDLQKRKLERSTSASGADTKKINNPMIYNNSITPPGHLGSSSVNHSLFPNSSSQSIYSTLPQVNGGDKKRGNHTQTYKEYKEALRQQRTCEGLSIYKSKDQTTVSENESSQINDSNSSEVKDDNSSTKNQYNEESSDMPKPIQKTPTLYNNCQYKTVNINNISSSSSNSEHDTSHVKHIEQHPYIKPSSPVTNSSNIFTTNHNLSPKISKVAANYFETNFSNYNINHSKSTTWNSSPEKYTFTMRREFERAKEEADLIELLKTNIETRLKMALPEDLAPALTDGVVLCHLANHVRPRSVASIHVPSPAVPKLTMARCRRNVDNFLEACRKIGVDEEVLMDADAIMDVGYMNAYGLEILSHLVSALIRNRREEDKYEERITGFDRTNEDRNMICCASDILEGGRGVIRIAVTVTELLKFYQSRSPMHNTSSPDNKLYYNNSTS